MVHDIFKEAREEIMVSKVNEEVVKAVRFQLDFGICWENDFTSKGFSRAWESDYSSEGVQISWESQYVLKYLWRI